MSASRIVLLRHGQTDFNLARRFQGRIDKPLNDAGRSQAAGAAGVLVSRLCEPSAEVGMIAAETHRSYDDGGVRIVCSPLGRARETARILARVFDIAGYPCEGPMPDERLTERFYGTFEGKTYEEIARASATLSSRRRPRAPPIALLSSSRTAPLSRGASFLCWAWTPRTSTGCAAWTTAIGRSSSPLACPPPRVLRVLAGAWRRTISGPARTSWGPEWPPGASFAPITQRFSSM